MNQRRAKMINSLAAIVAASDPEDRPAKFFARQCRKSYLRVPRPLRFQWMQELEQQVMSDRA